MKVAVTPSSISGLGVVARERIAAGEVIHTLSGEQIGLFTAVFRILIGRLSVDNPLMVGRTTFIHLDDLSVRFNHSCEPNAGLRRTSELFAHREIQCGEEITYDYALTVLPSVATSFWKMPCRCGAASCRASISNLRDIRAARLEELWRRRELQDFVLGWLDRKFAPRSGRTGYRGDECR